MPNAKPYIPGASADGAGGTLSLGPLQNTFDGANRAAAEAARDAYATANAAWLADYDADLQNRIQLTWDADPVGVIQRRNVAGNAWEDATGLVRGRPGTMGDDGAQARFVVYAYVNAAVAPAAAPASTTFTQSTDTLVVPAGYAATPSTPPDGQRTYRTEAVVNPLTDDDAVALVWSLPAALGGGSGGFTFRFGAGAPANTLGDDGDWYLNTTAGGFYSKASGAWTLRYTDMTGSGGGLTQAQVDARITALAALLAGADFTGAVTVTSPSGGPLTVQGENAGNSTIMKIFTPDSGSQKAFGAGREGEFDWVQFAGEIVAGKPGFALGPGTARDTNMYREEADHMKTDDAFTADELRVSGTLSTTQANLGIRTAAQIAAITDLLAPLSSPALTGTPTVPTAAAGTNNTQAASTAFVVARIAAAMLGGGADGVLASATYNDTNETLTLTLSNGTVLNVPLAALVAGFITSSEIASLVAAPTLTGRTLTFTDVDGNTTDRAIPTETAAEILAKILTVDGTGSGLDADLLDGMTPAEVAALGGSGGFALRFGAGAPANTLGDNGDWYLRTSNGQWLERVGGAWVARYTDMLGTAGGGQTETQVNTLIQAALAAAVTGNTETGIVVTHNADGTLDFVVGTTTAHDLIAGWSDDTTISDQELAAGEASDDSSVEVPTGTGNLYLFIWRADADGGDPSEVHIAGGGNLRNTFGTAVARTYGGTPGQLIISVTTQNRGLLGGETARVV